MKFNYETSREREERRKKKLYNKSTRARRCIEPPEVTCLAYGTRPPCQFNTRFIDVTINIVFSSFKTVLTNKSHLKKSVTSGINEKRRKSREREKQTERNGSSNWRKPISGSLNEIPKLALLAWYPETRFIQVSCQNLIQNTFPFWDIFISYSFRSFRRKSFNEPRNGQFTLSAIGGLKFHFFFLFKEVDIQCFYHNVIEGGSFFLWVNKNTVDFPLK